ncbi:MAG: rRNA maturation RNase YbeY [Puniceicoccaceae bacterium]
MTTPREIRITSRCEALRYDGESVEKCLRALDADPRFAIPPGELSVVFLGDAEMGELHGTFLGDPSPTDVITFPGDPDFGESGEICIGVERARAVHHSHGQDFSAEILLYLAHGWLHLAGYDDRSENDRRKMRLAEAEALSFLGDRVRPPVFSMAD